MESRETDWKPLQADDEGCLGPGRLASKFDSVDAREQFAHEGNHFDLREIHSKTGVDAETKPDVAVRRPVGDKCEGTLEGILIPVSRLSPCLMVLPRNV